MASKNQIVRFLHSLAETMDISPHQLAAAALEYANGVFGSPEGPGDAGTPEAEVPDTEDEEEGVASPPMPSIEPYTGPVHLCLDFGTAMSKAFAWNKDSDEPMPLRIGHAAGEPGSSPYALNSTIFISREGRVFFGQTAVIHAAAMDDPEHHQALQSIKDILTVGPMTNLGERVSSRYNPGGHPISRKDVVALYLAFLTDSALLALQEDHQEASRNVPRSYTKPVFDKDRDEWAANILNECAAVGQALADRFSGQWANGIPLDDLRGVIDEANASSQAMHLVVESGILPEPVAAFAGRVRNFVPDEFRRRLMLVIDAGAGTTDFAMFTLLEREGEMRLFRIKNSVTTIRIAGDDVDNALMDYLLQRAEVREGNSRRGAIMADLRRDIRLLKEELFRSGKVTRQLVNDMEVEAQLDEFEECSAMVQLRDRMQEKFNKVLSKEIDGSWLKFRELEMFFTGGGASLNMLTRLANRGQPFPVGSSMITPIPVIRPPRWFEDECEDISGSYSQLAVCIGGACYGAGKISLDLDRELDKFGGHLSEETQLRPDFFRDGQ